MAKIKCNVISYTLKRTIDIEVILPTVSIPESFGEEGSVHHEYPAKYPVVYLLHGYGNNQSTWGGYTNVEFYAEERKIAIVLIAGENKRYLDSGIDPFEKFIEEELPEFITNTFPISNEKKDKYIAGLSMGGFGALYHGLTYPHHYQAIGAFSPAVRMEKNPIDLFEVLNNTKESPAMFIACGDQDFLYQDVVEFTTKAQVLNLNPAWISVENYGHEWRFWNQCIEQFLDWIDRSDAYKGVKRKI